MIQEVTAKRYAEAVYLLARQEGKGDVWSRGLADLAALFREPAARDIMENPRVPLADKVALMEEVLSTADPLVLNLARLLLARGRAGLAPQIFEAFKELLDEARGIAHATVTTAVPLSKEDEQAVARRLSEMTGKQVVVETRTDPNILGGLIARIGDRLIDGSTRSSLEALRRQLAGSQA